MPYDTIVIGGSHAGLSGALQLLRARRKVLVADAGAPRNRFAGQAHAVLGADGAERAALMDASRAQLARYPTLDWHDGIAVTAKGCKDDFRVTTDDGTVHEGRRLLFAVGVSDTLPPIKGLAELWGQGVFHCPYCHGYELDSGPLAVVAVGAKSIEQARLLTDWGQVTLLTNQTLSLGRAVREELTGHGIAIEETPISNVTGPACIHLTDHRSLSFAGIFTGTDTKPASPVARSLGCAVSELPTEQRILTSERRETTVPGAYACGDAANQHHSISLAMGDGAWAGSQIHHSLICT